MYIKMDTNNDQDPVGQVINIHRQRIMKIVDCMVDKMLIAVCMDKLLSDDRDLLNKISETLQSNTIFKKTRFLTLKQNIMSNTSIFSTKMTSRQSSQQSFRVVDMKVNFIMDMVCKLYETPGIIKKVKTYELEEHEFFEFRQTLDGLRDYMQEMVSQTASEERDYFKQVTKAWIFNEKYKTHNKKLKKAFDEKEMALYNKIKEKNDLKENYDMNMQNMMDKNMDDIKHIIRISEKNMKQICKASEDALKLLREDVKHITEEYHKLLETNLIQERNLRKKRTKVETVLFNLLAKYDNDIGDLQNQLEAEQDGYDKEKQSYDQLMKKVEIQTVQYTELMTEKREEEERIWNEKYYKFQLQRSCRIIQRWWRRIYWKRHKKKKGKGKKGKKK